MSIKHHEQLKNLSYFKDRHIPCIVREMHDAPSNNVIAMHDHEFSELVIVAAGSLNHIHADRTDRLFAGDFFVIHPRERHGYAEFAPGTTVFNLLYHNSDPPFELLSTDSPLTSALFPAKSTNVKANTIGRISRRNLANVTILINAIQKEGKSIRSYSKRICNSLFTAIFFLLARETDHLHASSINPIQKEIDFMAQNIKNKITLSDICAISGRSACTLSRAFRKATGRSPIDYLISMRIAKAKCLLNNVGITLEKAALETGFCNASHLSTTLRTHASPCHRLQSHDRFLK